MKRYKKLTAAVLAAVMTLLLCACGAQEEAPPVLEGAQGDTLHTMFFDYAVEQAARVDDCGGAKPAEGMAFVSVNVTVTNTTDADIPMKDADFTLRWADGDDGFAWPRDAADDAMMPAEYTLAAGERADYTLVFEAPAQQTAFSLQTADYYYAEDGTAATGDVYTLTFTA